MEEKDRICKNCIHFVGRPGGGIFSDGACSILQKQTWFGERKAVEVRETGTCDYFSPITTKESGGYRNTETCFLTSACVGYMGKADDCKELTALRNFRDTYMKSTPEGRELVEEYYRIAPTIVENIDASPDRAKIYDGIYKTVEKCVALIENKEYEQTMTEYKNMVLRLQKDFGA